MAKADILQQFALFTGGTGGIDSWLTEDSPNEVFETLSNIGQQRLTRALLNQLLTLCHEAPLAHAFFSYYWLSAPRHPYDVRSIPCFQEAWEHASYIESLDHLYWGLYRFYVDALLFFGSVRTAYRTLRSMSSADLTSFFAEHIIDTDYLAHRGPSIGLQPIEKDNRYLISEMASNAYRGVTGSEGPATLLETVLLNAFDDLSSLAKGRSVTIGDLLDGDYANLQYATQVSQLRFAADEFLKEVVSAKEDILSKCQQYAAKFETAHSAALANTEYYLSMVGELDVYVATSMRSRANFNAMAAFCEAIFTEPLLVPLNLRYFDPTMSAAESHEDKGLIECLMVKCAKVLVYQAGQQDSYGKDAEAAMALSLGKPVIFFCDAEEKRKFLNDVHPLSRLIQFETGVAVGAMVTTEKNDVSTLLYRILNNTMEYEVRQDAARPGYLHLVEKLSGSVVRLQTSNPLLRETFWNHYQVRD